jgi:hypothetical protein
MFDMFIFFKGTVSLLLNSRKKAANSIAAFPITYSISLNSVHDRYEII